MGSKIDLHPIWKMQSKMKGTIFLDFLPQFAFWNQGTENSFKIDYLMTGSQTYEKNI